MNKIELSKLKHNIFKAKNKNNIIMGLNFKNKIVVITGAGAGIGKALAIEFSKLGAKLALNDVNQQKLKNTLNELKQTNKDVYIETFDIYNKNKFETFSKNIRKKYNQIDIIINNAGIAHTGFTHENFKQTDFKTLMNTNFWGTVNGSEIFLKIFKKQKTQATLVNMCSAFGIISPPNQIGYSTSKFAIRGYTTGLQQELKLTNPEINVLLVYPGGVKTEITKNAISPKDISKILKKDLMEDFNKLLITEPSKVAIKNIKAISNKKEIVYIGFDVKLINFLQRFLPHKISSKLFLSMFKFSNSYQLLFKKKGEK